MAFTSVGAINKISFVFPKIPLLSQPNEIEERIFCNESLIVSDDCLDNGICYCVHRLMALEHTVVEFILTNTGDRELIEEENASRRLSNVVFHSY
jgi:hypothetical protein